MKVKQISLSDELHERLSREDNASALVSRLLTKHYEIDSLKGLTLEEVRALKEKYAKKQELEQQINALGIQ